MVDDVTKLYVCVFLVQSVRGKQLADCAGFCMGVVPVGATPTSLHVIRTEGVVASPTSPHQPLSVLILTVFSHFQAWVINSITDGGIGEGGRNT